jgi:TATA-box binding protein (TBP) (component of TFIID and TFIIIB)
MYTRFEDINIYTTTKVISNNISINLKSLFDGLEVKEINVPLNIRKKDEIKQYILDNLELKDGDITSLEYDGQTRGYKIEKRRKNKPRKKIQEDISQKPKKYDYFRNHISLVMKVENKLVNCKIPHEGKLQLTGCTNMEQTKIFVKCLWKHIEKHPEVYTFRHGNNFESVIETVMSAIVFNLNFNVDRECLDNYINTNTYFNSIFEPTSGYPGVNIKVPFNYKNDETYKVLKLSCMDEDWVEEELPLSQFTEFQASKKKSNNTFLVFHSGKVIMSGKIPLYMREVYENFNQLILGVKDIIEERIS